MPARRRIALAVLSAVLLAAWPLRAPAVAAEPGALPGDVAVKVGDEQISRADLEAVLAYEPAPLLQRMREDDNFARIFAVRWFHAELFARAAQDDGLLARKPGLGAAAADLGRNLLASEYMREMVEVEQEPTETEIKTYYSMNPELCTPPKRFHLARLGVEVAQRASEAELEGAKKRLGEMQSKLAAGVPFGQVADELSDLPSKESGGDVGWLTAEELGKDEGSAALTRLAPGTTSEVIRTRRGQEIFRMLEVEEGKPKSLEECKPLIVARIKKEYASAARQRRADELVKRYGASMNLDAFLAAARAARAVLPSPAASRETEPARP